MKCLFVCLGNICRSPTAEGVFRHKLTQLGKSNKIHCDSAGTSAWHIGSPPDERSIRHALKRGYDLSAQRARQVTANDFLEFDFIFAMDKQNLRELQELRRQAASAPGSPEECSQLSLFLAPPGGPLPRDEVPDPYHLGAEGFEEVLDLIECASDRWITHLLKRKNAEPSHSDVS